MFYLIQQGQERPSTLEKNKDDMYHLKMARYCVGQSNNNYQNDFGRKVELNKKFYKNEQWILEEDTELFFKDISGGDRNRLKIGINYIKPMVHQYRGNAIRMGVNFRARGISKGVKNRMEQALAEMLWYTKIANEGNPFREDLMKNKAIGENEGETEAIFNNIYQDKYVKTINDLIRYVSEKNELDSLQDELSINLALSGLGVIKTFEHGGHQEFAITQSENFFFDRSCKKLDLTDSQYMGEVVYMLPTEIFEAYPDMSLASRQAIEKWAQQARKEGDSSIGTINQNNSTINSDKIPVFVTYWKDGESDEFGYVKDQFGYERFTEINKIFDGEDKPRYTDADLIKSNSPRAKRILGDKLKRRMYVDSLRTCHFIPSEIFTRSIDSNKKESDVILDYGLAPYQETDAEEVNSVKFPFKCFCWAFVDGEILSPVDDAINPQRFINRMLSIAENQINNSRGAGTVYDKSMVSDEGEFLSNMNMSKPVGIEAKGRGIQNAVGAYDGTIRQGTMIMFNIIDAMKGYFQDVTGVNEALKGESTGSDQLVGVTQLLIQKGSLMQEPFYNAITQIFKQCYQSIASMGKRIYAENERELAVIAGDEGVKIIQLTKDYKLEEFRVFVKRENADEMLVNAANQMLLQFVQIGMLDQERFSNLYGRSTPDEVAQALRDKAKENRELQRMQEKKAAQQNQSLEQQLAAQDAQNQYAIQKQEAKNEMDVADARNHDLAKEAMKGLAKIAPNNPKATQELMKKVK